MVERQEPCEIRPPLCEQNGAILVRRPGGPLIGQIRPPGDKSISHRALLLGSLAEGTSTIANFLPAGDCLATLGCLRSLDIDIHQRDVTNVRIQGRGLRGLKRPSGPLDCVRSGTTMRLLAGILAGQEFDSVLSGDPQLLRRPMRRVVEPLRRMGALIDDTEGHGPLTVRGSLLSAQHHDLAVASAQVKSALLLAGLYARGTTVIRQPGPARDHTERMLCAMGAEIGIDGLTVSIQAPGTLAPLDLIVPGDISSAAFLLVAALLIPDSRITARQVGVNSTRTGILDVLEEMGAHLEIEHQHRHGDEPVADITVSAGPLLATEIGGDTVVRMIDEFPVLAIAATQAKGTTVVRDAAELRVKETDRIATVAAELAKMGARIEPRPDGFLVEGPTPLHGAVVDSHGDHRLGMALVVAGLIANGETIVQRSQSIADSFPGFVQRLAGLMA